MAPNLAPTVTVSSPATAITGDVVALTATAADSDGSVAQVEFFVDGISVGVDASSPFAANYTAVLGNHSVTAVATDNQGATKTSTAVALAVANNQAPTVSVSNAATAVVGDVVTVTATAADADGSVSTVEFFVDNVSVGTDNIIRACNLPHIIPDISRRRNSDQLYDRIIRQEPPRLTRKNSSSDDELQSWAR